MNKTGRMKLTSREVAAVRRLEGTNGDDYHKAKWLHRKSRLAN